MICKAEMGFLEAGYQRWYLHPDLQQDAAQTGIIGETGAIVGLKGHEKKVSCQNITVNSEI